MIAQPWWKQQPSDPTFVGRKSGIMTLFLKSTSDLVTKSLFSPCPIYPSHLALADPSSLKIPSL